MVSSDKIVRHDCPERRIAALDRSLLALLRDNYSFWLAAAEKSTTAEHRQFCRERAQTLERFLLASEDWHRRFEQDLAQAVVARNSRSA